MTTGVRGLNQPVHSLLAIATRRVSDGDGVEWRVIEVAARHVPGSCGDFCLIFDAPGICHRLWEYPAHWATLPDEQLLALRHRHRRTPRRSVRDPVRGVAGANATGDIRAA